MSAPDILGAKGAKAEQLIIRQRAGERGLLADQCRLIASPNTALQGRKALINISRFTPFHDTCHICATSLYVRIHHCSGAGRYFHCRNLDRLDTRTRARILRPNSSHHFRYPTHPPKILLGHKLSASLRSRNSTNLTPLQVRRSHLARLLSDVSRAGHLEP